MGEFNQFCYCFRKGVSEKAGLNADVSEATLKNAREITEKAIRAYKNQNTFATTSTDMAKKAFEAFNENTKSFATLNKEIMDSMIVLQTRKTK